MSSFATHATAPVPSPFSSAIEAPNELDEDMLRRINGHFVKGHKQDLQSDEQADSADETGS